MAVSSPSRGKKNSTCANQTALLNETGLIYCESLSPRKGLKGQEPILGSNLLKTGTVDFQQAGPPGR